MKVKELVDMLSKLDQDTEVYCVNPLQGGWEIKPVTEIGDHCRMTSSKNLLEVGYLIV